MFSSVYVHLWVTAFLTEKINNMNTKIMEDMALKTAKYSNVI